MKNTNDISEKTENIKPVEIEGGLLAHNTVLNLVGRIIPLLIGMGAIPFVIRGLGNDRFGLLSIAWVILGYFTVFDLGLGRATTKYVSEAMGKGVDGDVPRIVWTAATAQLLLGLVGGAVLAAVTPLLIEHVLKVPTVLILEAKTTFYVLSFSVPVVLVSSSFGGVLEARQRFDLVNAINIPSSCATYVLSLVGLALGFRLPGIVALILLARVGSLIAFVGLSIRILPNLKSYSGTRAFFRQLITFGGWITVTNIIGPILVYFDRFLIGALISMAALAFYSAPYEMVSRLSIIPSSLTITLFPAFSMLEGSRDKRTVELVFGRSIKYTLITLGPIVVAMGLFAHDGLRLWLGQSFAQESALALKILAIGVMFNSLAFTPISLLQAVGRPDIPAKFHLLELPVHIAVAWILVINYAIAGAALAWTIRVFLDALLLFTATIRTRKLRADYFIKNGLISASFALILLAGAAYGTKIGISYLPLLIQGIIIFLLFSIFAWIVWKTIVDASEKEVVIVMVRRFLGRDRHNNAGA